MFCDGKCEYIENNEQKRCGLLYEVIMEHVGPNGGKNIETIKKCAFHFMIDSLHRQEQGQVRFQASMAASRNQKANDDNRSANIIAVGMMGLMHAFNEDPEKFRRTLKLLENESKKPLELE